MKTAVYLLSKQLFSSNAHVRVTLGRKGISMLNNQSNNKLNNKEKAYQQLAASERFQRSRDEYAANQLRLAVEPVEVVDTPARVAIRKTLATVADPFTSEAILDTNDLVSINYLTKGQRTARSVCRIIIRDSGGNTMGYGTGFLVTSTLLLTNHHVLSTQTLASNSLAEFDYEFDGTDLPKASKIFQLDAARFFYNDRGLDFALVAVHPKSTTGTELSEYGYLKMIFPSGKVLINEPVTIVQHPGGKDKQIAVRNNRVLGLTDGFIHYETDTEPGSSGSPVFNDQWQVAALHHAGVPRKNSSGQMLTKDGRVWQPTMDRSEIDWIANEGVRISAIGNHLRAKNDWQPQQLDLIRELFGTEQTDGAGGPESIRPDLRIITPETLTIKPPTAPVITLDEFFAMVGCANTTEAELAPYVRLDLQQTAAFTPVFRLNEALVDTQGLEGSTALKWANMWSQSRRQERYRKKIAEGSPVIKIVSEGDSWFQFPFLLHDVIDYLMDREELAVFSLDAAGDQLQDMVAKAEYMDAIAQEQPDIFLISGGGNDLVNNGRLSSLLYPYKHGRVSQDYLNGAFGTFSDKMRADYRRLFRSICERFPTIRIICHGYDYAIPKTGRSLGMPLAQNGIQEPGLQRQIMRHVIDYMNDIVIQTAGEFSNVTYLNLRDTVSPDGWFDELHPLNNGFGDIANKFIKAIHAN